jgi:hypothetical protein
VSLDAGVEARAGELAVLGFDALDARPSQRRRRELFSDLTLDEAIARAGHPLAKARTSWP